VRKLFYLGSLVLYCIVLYCIVLYGIVLFDLRCVRYFWERSFLQKQFFQKFVVTPPPQLLGDIKTDLGVYLSIRLGGVRLGKQ
jgi:hypothetical protein